MDYDATPQVRIGDWINEGWRMFAEQWKAWVLHSLVFFGMIGVPVLVFGIFLAVLTPLFSDSGDTAIPLLFVGMSFLFTIYVLLVSVWLGAGMYHSAFKQLRGGQLQLSDLFAETGKLIPILGAAVIIGVLAMIGALLCVIPYFIVMGWFFFTVPLIVERNLGALEALKASREVTQKNLLMFILYAFLVMIISQVGTYLCYVGLLVTQPLLFTMTAVAYRDCFGLNGARSFAEPVPAADAYAPPASPMSPASPVSPASPIQYKQCPNCQARLPLHSTFCSQCGGPV